MKITKTFGLIIGIGIILFASSCSKKEVTYSTNGETIFRTGKNIDGTILQDMNASDYNSKVHGCADCHGDNGKGKYRGGDEKETFSITYNDLTNSTLYSPVYNDSLIERFIDSETKSDGTHANTGVVFKMSKTGKIALIEFLKTL